MAAGTRVRALDAAVELIGVQGVRALSHARVDRQAGLPPGSTSNWFRTRRALIAGVVDHIAESERADLGHAGMRPIADLPGLVEGLSEMAELLTGVHATRTRARYALFLEVVDDPELAAPLHRQRREFERWAEGLIDAAGIGDPASATRALMALADGLLLHRLTVDPALDLRPVLERAMRGLAGP